ncbi:alpha/beta family hydrolase, partial [Nocardia cyriacigeorgica]|uniref:alpha/beta family hydrolase n=1 Tax=Nocardia cyriacigeorgica TaxID=135487 RepID=UPI00313E06EF
MIALSFPLHPPGKPEKSRREELLATGDIEVVVINGGSDPFGIPDNVTARVVPSNLFAVTSVELVYNGQSDGHLEEGSIIEED